MRLLALAALAAVVLVPAASAHGDPVSDRLLVADVSFPEAGVSDSAARRLTGDVERAREEGYEIKVAVVASPSDLGPRAAYFGQPEELARYLAFDLAGLFQGVSLVVMPGSFGIATAAANVDRERSALTGLRPGSDATAITEGASAAVRRLAAAAGTPISRPKGSGESSFWGDRLTLAVLAVVVLGLLVGLGLLGRGRISPRAAPE